MSTCSMATVNGYSNTAISYGILTNHQVHKFIHQMLFMFCVWLIFLCILLAILCVMNHATLRIFIETKHGPANQCFTVPHSKVVWQLSWCPYQWQHPWC